MNLARWIVAASVALVLAGCGRGGDAPSPVPTEGVTDAMIAAADGNEWLTYGRDYAEQRLRSSDLVNQPAQRRLLHPRANER